MPEITETLYVSTAAEWRAWLSANYQTRDEIWLILPHKDTGRTKIPYNDAVEEALCFGWIDSTVKSYGADASVQRFTPRKNTNRYSQQNKERLRLLSREGKLLPDIEKAVQPVLHEEFIFPTDIIAALKANPEAWKHYQTFSDTYKRIRVAYVDERRSRPELFEKALANFIQKTAQGKQIGYGGIDKYF